MNKEIINDTIDKYSLRFLDEFEEVHKRLPSDLEFTLWRVGFVDGLEAIREMLGVDTPLRESDEL